MTHDAYSTKRVTVWTQSKEIVSEGKLVTLDGYAIKYADGYISWCPNSVYERDYQPITALSFGHAIHALKAGKRVCRAGWNGKGMWLELLRGDGKSAHFTMDGMLPVDDCIGMKTAGDTMQPGWLASQADILANDWQIVGEV